MKNECFIILLFAAITNVVVEGLHCYSCTTFITNACGDPFDSQEYDVRRIICPAEGHQVCTKTVVYNGNKKPIEIKRDCKNKASFKVVDDAIQWRNFCEVDYCNRAMRVDTAASVLVSLALMQRGIVLF